MNHEILIKNFFHYNTGCGNYQLLYTPIGYNGENIYSLSITNRNGVYEGHLGEKIETEQDVLNYIDKYFKIAGLR